MSRPRVQPCGRLVRPIRHNVGVPDERGGQVYQLHRSFGGAVDPILDAVPVLVLAAALLTLWRRSRGEPAAARRSVLEALVALWLYVVVVVTVVPSGELAGTRVVLRPGDTLRPLADAVAGGAAFELAANMLLFLPFGFLVPLLLPSARGLGAVVVLGASVVVGVEIAQYVLGVGRAATLDDALVGVLGAVLGYALATPLRRLDARRQGYGAPVGARI